MFRRVRLRWPRPRRFRWRLPLQTPGQPLLLLHGAFMNVAALGDLVAALAKTRQVIAVDLESHGRTADLDRPLSFDQMTEDLAGILPQLGVKQTGCVRLQHGWNGGP